MNRQPSTANRFRCLLSPAFWTLTPCYWTLFLLCFFLTSCGGTYKPAAVQTKVVRTYPDLPPIEPLPPLALMPFEWDYPRDQSKMVPKSTKECLDVPDEQRNGAYWEKCGEHPPLENSNIFMGLDRQSYETFIINNEKMKARLLQYKTRIEELNREREEWRLKNKQAGEVMLEEEKK